MIISHPEVFFHGVIFLRENVDWMIPSISKALGNHQSSLASVFTRFLCYVSMVCGILGGLAGSRGNKKIKDRTVERLFIGLMAVIIVINIYNIFRYM